MNRVLITGASGLVGNHLLRLLIDSPTIGQIVAPTRRPLVPTQNVQNPHDPQLSDALSQVQGPIDTVFCCLGSTMREAGSKQAFVLADYTLVVDTALTGQRLGARHMLVVSALGANSHSPFFYNRVKGEMEESLIAQHWPRLTIARPSMLLGRRETLRIKESLFAPLFKLLPGKWAAIKAQDVARALLNSALTPGTSALTVLDSASLREIALNDASANSE